MQIAWSCLALNWIPGSSLNHGYQSPFPPLPRPSQSETRGKQRFNASSVVTFAIARWRIVSLSVENRKLTNLHWIEQTVNGSVSARTVDVLQRAVSVIHTHGRALSNYCCCCCWEDEDAEMMLLMIVRWWWGGRVLQNPTITDHLTEGDWPFKLDI